MAVALGKLPLQKVHSLLQGNHAARICFCCTIVGQQLDNNTFISNILLIDIRDVVINLHNLQSRCDENPHATVATHNQLGLNV